MTIEEAIKMLQGGDLCRSIYEEEEALDMGIRSLEAWEKVKAEIDQKQYDFMADKDYDEGVRFGLMLAYQIIDKYLQEVTTDADHD